MNGVMSYPSPAGSRFDGASAVEILSADTEELIARSRFGRFAGQAAK